MTALAAERLFQSGADRLERISISKTRRTDWQDHDLTLFPQSWLRIRAGYSRVKQDGAALTTEQEFNSRDPVYPIFRNLRQQFDEYRLGGDIQFKSFRFTVQRRWEYFKEDTQDTASGALTFHRGQPLSRNTPSWLGNLITSAA